MYISYSILNIFLMFHFITFMVYVLKKSCKHEDTHVIKGIIKQPCVSICVLVCDEPTEMVKNTVKQLLFKIKYPNKKIYVIENSKRKDDIFDYKKFCDSVGVCLIDIPNLGNKSRVLNYFIKNILDTPFVVSIDSDQKVCEDIITDLLPLFCNKIAVIQTPQCFENRNRNFLTFLYSGMQDVFNFICFKRNLLDMALCLGTNFIARSDILKEIGGFPENCIVEDIALSFELNVRGYEIKHIDTVYFKGLAPHNIRAYFTQTTRYCIGNYQMLIITLSNFFSKTLSTRKKIGYIQISTGYLIPIASILKYLLSRYYYNMYLELIFGTIASLALISLVISKHRTKILVYFSSVCLFYLSCPIHFFAIIKFIVSRNNTEFEVTPKN